MRAALVPILVVGSLAATWLSASSGAQSSVREVTFSEGSPHAPVLPPTPSSWKEWTAYRSAVNQDRGAFMLRGATPFWRPLPVLFKDESTQGHGCSDASDCSTGSCTSVQGNSECTQSDDCTRWDNCTGQSPGGSGGAQCTAGDDCTKGPVGNKICTIGVNSPRCTINVTGSCSSGNDCTEKQTCVSGGGPGSCGATSTNCSGFSGGTSGGFGSPALLALDRDGVTPAVDLALCQGQRPDEPRTALFLGALPLLPLLLLRALRRGK